MFHPNLLIYLLRQSYLPKIQEYDVLVIKLTLVFDITALADSKG